MRRAALALLALATLTTTGCAAMGTKRGQGAQIQRTAEPPPSLDSGSLDARPELGQR
jgi:predicted small secreted protein